MNYPGSLHNHTDYSNLRLRDATNTYKDLIDYAVELGHEVIAITEHETISNAVKVEKYYNKVKQNHPDFKVILGNEIYLCRDGLDASNYVRGEDYYYHFILLAKDAIGHQQIRELSSRAWGRSYSSYAMTRVPTYYQDLIDIIQSNPGHVIGSTACIGGFLPRKILQWVNTNSTDLWNKIKQWCHLMQGIFGKEDFYLELQPSHNDEQVIVNKNLLLLSDELNIPYIITTDSHYLKKEEAPIHKAFLNAQDGEREVDAFYASTYMMNTEELESYFPYIADRNILEAAYNSIKEIKNKCEDYSLLRPLKIPNLKWRNFSRYIDCKYWYTAIPMLQKFSESPYESDEELAFAVIDGINSHPDLQNQEAYDEINACLEDTWVSSEVNKARWSAYFLNLQTSIDVCWNAGTLVGCGRGSGVGFILLYCLDITQINPLRETTKCFRWRFLNPDRVSVLDIDTDIEGGRRPIVLQALRDFYGEDRVANVVTFGTEKSKSAIQTACRGLGIDNDIGLYLASLIPADRGQTRTLKECYYGDEEKGFDPIYQFKREMDYNYPELWKVAQKIEGLVCRVGEHAGGVIFVDEPFTNSTALMKVPNGDVVTQFDLHDCEDVSLIKIDLLSVEALDKIHNCLDLLVEYGYIEPGETLHDTYEKAIGIYNLERNDPKMWKMIWDHDIQSLFQMEKQSGIQGINLIKPKSVDDLAVLNSVIRLMASERGGEQPLAMWARYRKDIRQWYTEMKKYGLSNEEIEWLSQHSAVTDGICESQEGLMSLVQEPRLGGNSLSFADKCRKGIAKKQGALFEECEQTYYKNIKEQQLSEKLAHYVWDVLLKVQRGYSFNRSHCLAYSLVALQEMNLCFKYPILFWNTACLITDSGAEDASTNYDKIASAIGKMIKAGIKIGLPDINKSSYKFIPDVENNQILFGLKGMLRVGDDLINDIIEHRPYVSIKDFMMKVKTNKQSMISLIKGGAFDNLMDRKLCMGWYLWETCDKKKRITLQNMGGLIRYKLLPEDTKERVTARRIYEFNRYLKSVCKQGDIYVLDERAQAFLEEMNYENLFAFGNVGIYILVKEWDKVYQSWMNVIREWITADQDIILHNLNKEIFRQEWEKYATGSISAWEMEALCFYYHEHELAHLNEERYGFANFFDLPQQPVVDRVFYKAGKEIKMFSLSKIAGTCIAKNKNKSTVTLLTVDGVVEVKFRKEYFSLFDKQISERGEDGKKHVLERSWFNRGSMIVVLGMRSDDMFIVKKYASSAGHQLYKIDNIDADGNLTLRNERMKGMEEEDDGT